MNGTPPPTIQIIAPFTAALDWMKMMLFRPFDFAKWLTVAFAAFLAGNFGGNFRTGRSWNIPDWNYRFRRDGFSDWNFEPWLIALFVGGGLFVLALAIVWMWVSARGRFMFTDCVVKNRGAIAEPWHEYRREGNSFFIFSLVIGLCCFLLVALTVLFMWMLFGGFGRDDGGAMSVIFIVMIAVVVLFWVVISIVVGVVTHFMVPVMYRRRCSAREAFFDVLKLIGAYPGPFVLFVLFSIALVIAVGIIGTVIACMTCCIGGLPYISTVILLPAIVWMAAYKLLFIRQFGDAYDVWATVAPPPAPTTEPLPPPAG